MSSASWIVGSTASHWASKLEGTQMTCEPAGSGPKVVTIPLR